MVLGEGLVTSEGTKHAQHKKLMSPAFNQSSIQSNYRLMHIHAESKFMNQFQYVCYFKMEMI